MLREILKIPKKNVNIINEIRNGELRFKSYCKESIRKNQIGRFKKRFIPIAAGTSRVDITGQIKRWVLLPKCYEKKKWFWHSVLLKDQANIFEYGVKGPLTTQIPQTNLGIHELNEQMTIILP